MSDGPQSHAPRRGPVFEFSAAPGGGGSPLHGLWDFKPAARGGIASFASFAAPGAESAAETPVWVVPLPSDPGLAEAQLKAAEARLEGLERALAAASSEFEKSAPGTQRPAGVPASAARYGPSPERLKADLSALSALARGESAGVSFGLGSEALERWESVRQEFEDFIEKVRQMLVHYAWVETRLGGILLGRTVVSWTGDMSTVWGGTPAPAALALHRRSLALALKSREALLRVVIVVAKGVAVISSGAGVLALPLVWKYVEQLAAEIGAWRELAREG